MNAIDFGQCHNLVDPMPYLMACQDSVCTGGGYCESFEAYARKCQQVGVCLIWRSSEICTYTCPPHLEYQPCGPACEVTCDTVNEISDAKCAKNFEEGCFCPHGLALHNNTCIPKEKCLTCDEEGHIEGDVWFPDACTECTCSRSAVNCRRTECPAVSTICEESMTPVSVNGTAEECCVKYVCVPNAVTTVAPFCAEEAQMPECGYGQVMKVSLGADGCNKFICECLPPSECPSLNEVNLEVVELQPGFVQVTNTSGCCPRSMTICDPQTCLPAPICSDYYEVITVVEENSCCASYKCAPRKDLCLYNNGSNSGIEMSEHVVAKSVGEQWMNDRCTSCVCEPSDEGAKPKCTTMECLKAVDHPDISDFVVEEVVLQDKCCPSFERSACKDGEKVYEEGEVWQPNPEDSCTVAACVRDESGIQKQIKVQECKSACDLGFEYRPADNRSVSCCGRCVPVACVVGNEAKNVGEEWQSSDFCTRYSCRSNDQSVYVESVTEKCPEIDWLEEMEFEIEKQYVPGQCCPQFVKTGCRYSDTVYKPGEKWKSMVDNCVTEFCVLDLNVTKYKQVEVCSKKCALGWVYEEQKGQCCGTCRQTHCVVGDTMYEADATWSSADNCTFYTCMDQGGQLSVSSSSVICPDVTNCPETSIYTQNCCKMCNLTAHNQMVDQCAADVMEPQNTVGMFSASHRIHGICKNLAPIEGIAECHGKCESATYIDTGNNLYMYKISPD